MWLLNKYNIKSCCFIKWFSGKSARQTEFGADESDLFLTDVRTFEESGITLHFNARDNTHTHTLVTQQQTLAQWSALSETLHTDTITYKQLREHASK